MSVNIKYKNNSIATLTDTGTKTLKTSGKYCEADIIVENTKDVGGGNVATGTFTPADLQSDVTVEHGLGVAPSTIVVVPMPTGADDKTNPISFYIAKKDAGGIVLGGVGYVNQNFSSLSYRTYSASDIAKQWAFSASSGGGSRVQAVDAQKFVVKSGFGVRTILWFAAV